MSTLFSLGATSLDGYQVATGDTTTAASAVTAALVEAEELLEEELGRSLPSEARTKAFKIWPDGRLYPDAYPISSVTDLSLEDTRTVLGASPDAGPFVGIIEGIPDPPVATITWTGGFTAPSGAHPLPATLRRAIYDLAHGVLADSPVPVGVTAASVGDVSVSYGDAASGGIDAVVPGLSERVGKYRNRRVG